MGVRQILPDGSTAGALSPASSVVSETAFGQSSAVGVSANYARQDHTHGTPAAPTVINNSASTAVLGADFAITGAGTFQDTGLSVSLPTAGTYLVQADVRGVLTMTSGTGYISAELYNSTDAAVVSNSETFVVISSTTNSTQTTTSILMTVTVAASKTIKLYAKRDGGGTFTASNIGSDANGRTRLSYLKVS